MRVIATHTFGRDGNAQPFQCCGFASPEDGFTWSIGQGSRLALHDVTGGAGTAYLLELALNPFVPPGTRARQRLMVDVNGHRISDEALEGEGTVAYLVPRPALRPDGRLAVTLHHPDARSPAELGVGHDSRKLGFMLRSLRVLALPLVPPADLTVLPPQAWPGSPADMLQAVRAVTGLAPRELTMCFESLGHNCEFGLVQRHVGAEPLGLLRFAGITLDDLLAGLRRGFEGVGEDVVVRTGPAGGGRREYLVHDETYRIGLHTFRATDEASPAQIRTEHGGRLRYLHRHFQEWLRTGERIFVFQRPGQITHSQARALLAWLRSFGPNSLLYVDQTPGMPSGAVAQLELGLFHGRLERMAPAEDVGLADLPGWLSLCANAYVLWLAARR